MDKRLKFNEPWILQRADPYVYEKDGWYYFTASRVWPVADSAGA